MKQKIYASKCLKTKPNKNSIINECKFIRKQQLKQAIKTKQCKRYNNTWPDSIKKDDIETSGENVNDFVQNYIDQM